MKKEKRFEVVHKETASLSISVTVLVDRETGVQYLMSQNGYGGGLTVLVDRDGKPLLYKEQRE